MADFLLEINVEDLPAGYVTEALRSMRDGVKAGLGAFNIICDGRILDYGTKNSLRCYMENLPLQQETVSQEIIGPPKSIAFGKNGEFTAQAIGFAKNQGVKPADLKIKSTPKGDYVYIQKTAKPGKTKEILEEIIPGIIKNTRFPKTMRWDDSGLRFARPIESVLALFGTEALDVKICNVPQKKIKTASQRTRYLKEIKKLCLSGTSGGRKEKIKKLVLGIIKNFKADEYIDGTLLEEVTYMVNNPDVFFGEFDKRFLELPPDVLKASMAKYQRIFPVSKNGKLLNNFIAVIDGKCDKKRVRKVYENILEAKLKDSMFFLSEDTKRPLADYIPQLKDLIFQKDLGSMFEKIQRLKVLCGFICDRLGLANSLKTSVVRAAELCKADLVSHMVGEFPSLQGIMGREYALRSGETKEVAIAIGEHYLPQGMDDNLPETKLGAVLSIAEKIDNIVGFFGMGVETSGSFDLFGIRRNTLGFILVVKKDSFRLSLGEVFEKAISLYGDKLKIAPAVLKDKINNHIKHRIEFLFSREPGPALIDLRKAVLDIGFLDIVDTFKRYQDLKKIHRETYFLQAAKVAERTSNILKGAKGEKIGEVNPSLFKEELEKKVWTAYLSNKDRISSLIKEEKYIEATRLYGEVFFEVLHEFFDKVLVNEKDNALRANRLAMMQAINRLYTNSVADLAMLPQIVV